MNNFSEFGEEIVTAQRVSTHAPAVEDGPLIDADLLEEQRRARLDELIWRCRPKFDETGAVMIDPDRSVSEGGPMTDADLPDFLCPKRALRADDFVVSLGEERRARLRKRFESSWEARDGGISAHNLARERADRWSRETDTPSVQVGDSLAQRNRRLDRWSQVKRPSGSTDRRRTWAVPQLISFVPWRGGWQIRPDITRRSPARQIAKAKALYELGLKKKAQRELACDNLGAVIPCRGAHRFRAAYGCNHRFCDNCGPRKAGELFAKHIDKIRLIAEKLVPCWPPHPGKSPRQSSQRSILPCETPARCRILRAVVS